MYLVDGLSQRQIARKLGISRNTVAKYCEGNTYPGLRASYCRAASVMTPDILRFIEQCLHEDRLKPNKKQHHTAKRIYERLVEEKSFTGAQSTVRRIVAKLRGHPQEAFVPLAFAPGDAMQIDWGEAVIYLAGERTKVQMFCARLAYSCAPFAVCFRRQNTEAFLEGLIQALNFFGGVMRRVLFDNARVAVKEGAGKNAMPQESYAALAAHYCFPTDFCNAASGNEKGLVENLVGWTRRNLLVPVPRVASLAELNQRLRDGCESYIASHQVAGKLHPVAHLLQEERQALLPLPGRPYDVRRTEVCRISLQATVRFQGNAYSVPVQYAGQEAALKAGAERDYDARQEKTRQRRLKRAHFPLHKTLEEFDLARLQHIQPEFVKQLASCTNDLLLIDELSYARFNQEESELLFKVISERSERASTIITTNLVFSKWTEMFASDTLVAALVDRLTYRSHVLNMNGESYRLSSGQNHQNRSRMAQ